MKKHIGQFMLEKELNSRGTLEINVGFVTAGISKIQAIELCAHITKVFLTDEIKKEMQEEEKDDEQK